MDDSMEISEVCRLCLSKDDKSLSVFAKSGPGGEVLSSKIYACLNFEVLSSDDLPKQICYICSSQIEVWYHFKLRCEGNQSKLKSWQCQLNRANDSTVDIDEAIHIKQEPPDFPSECGPSAGLEVSTNVSDTQSHISLSPDNVEVDGLNDNDEQHPETRMNIVIMDTASIPSDNLSCSDHMVPTVIQIQPEDEDLLRTVVESGEGLRDDEEEENEVTVIQVGKDSSGSELMEEITLDEDSSNPSIIEETLEEELESQLPPASTAFVANEAGTEPETQPTPVGLGNGLLTIKTEKDDFSWTLETSTDSVTPNTPTVEASSASASPMWKCPKCPRSFSSNKTKNIHLTKSHKVGTAPPKHPGELVLPKIVNASYDEENLKCKLCVRIYPSLYDLWRHMRRSHEDRKPFACAACRRPFKNKRELTSHRLRTISKYCRSGKITSEATDVYIVNEKVPRNQMGRYSCKECPAQFKCGSSVKKHFTIHTGELPYQCPKCWKEFREYKTANLHNKACNAPLPTLKNEPHDRVAPRNDVRLYKCPKCPKVFQAYNSMWKHKKACLKKHFCIKCSKTINADDWDAHKASCSPSNDKTPYSRKRIERTSLTLKDILDIHKNEYTKDGQTPRQLTCKVCHNDFSSVKSLKAHIRKHSALLKCDICNLTVQHESTLREHMKSYHYGQEATETPAALPTLKARSALGAKHKVRFPGFTATKVKCDQCQKLFSSLSALHIHKRTHNPTRGKDTSLLTCPVCKRVFLTVAALKSHRKVHKTIQLKMKIYKCNSCANSYSDAKDLHLHKTSDHPDEDMTSAQDPSADTDTVMENCYVKLEEQSRSSPSGSHKCDTCGKEFRAESSLLKHKKLHVASLEISKYSCESCNRSFVTAKSFDSHKGWHSRISSSLPKLTFLSKAKHHKFSCPVCCKVFNNKANTKRHMSLVNHTYKGPPLLAPAPVASIQPPAAAAPAPTKTEYRCKLCAEVFTDLRSLKQHLQSHPKDGAIDKASKESQPEGPLVCNLCKKTLRSLQGYKKHLLGHSNQKPFPCDVCSNQYSSETALMKHKQAHDFKAFACNKCKSCFTEKEELLSHYESCSA